MPDVDRDSLRGFIQYAGLAYGYYARSTAVRPMRTLISLRVLQ